MDSSRHPAEAAPWSGRAILHVDLDAFFAAVEQLDHPEWRGLPVIVGGRPDSRGVVSTASYEARVFGIRSAMPSRRAAELCPHAIWAPPHFERYRALSDAVFAIFREHSPTVQPVSIDEAFLDLSPGRFGTRHPVTHARLIRSEVAALGITASVGVSTSKTVSKIASDFRKPDGLTVVAPGDESGFLSPLPVAAMGGIGRVTASRLASLGIHTLGDLGSLDDRTALDVLGSHGPELAARSRGVDERPVSSGGPVKSVSNEKTFSSDVRTAHEVNTAVGALSDKVAQRLRKKGLSGRTVTVKLRFSDFTTRTAQHTFSCPTDDPALIAATARDLLDSVWNRGVGLRLLGVGVSGFETRTEQLSLTDSAPGPRLGPSRALLREIDAVRERFGPDALRFGRELPSVRREAEFDSPERPEEES